MVIRFWQTQSGRSPVEDFLSGASQSIRADFFDAITLLLAGEVLAMPLSRNLSSIKPGLHELRLKDRAGIYRFFYFIKKADGIYFVHVIKKKTQALPKSDIDLIRTRLGGL